MECENESTTQVMTAVEAHTTRIRELQAEHAVHAADINKYAENTFQNNYMVCCYVLLFQ